MFDDAANIQEEWDNYREFVTNFIPFRLRPNLDENRCILGAKKGILVGDFVDESESLWDAARHGKARSVFYSLFDRTLGGWRSEASRGEIQKKDLTETANEQGLAWCHLPDRIPADRLEKARA